MQGPRSRQSPQQFNALPAVPVFVTPGNAFVTTADSDSSLQNSSTAHNSQTMDLADGVVHPIPTPAAAAKRSLKGVHQRRVRDGHPAHPHVQSRHGQRPGGQATPTGQCALHDGSGRMDVCRLLQGTQLKLWTKTLGRGPCTHMSTAVLFEMRRISLHAAKKGQCEP